MDKVYVVTSTCFEDGRGVAIVPHISKIFKTKEAAGKFLDEIMERDEKESKDKGINIVAKDWVKGRHWSITFTVPFISEAEKYNNTYDVREYDIEG